ncbi:hypothetical protein [Streptosporangium sp. NPDC006007]|uniref:hypothetical protein n=1 Tax=Streptosporangium sp. NPDC006007 TaxID=3154575 RepID=UPI0033ACDE16
MKFTREEIAMISEIAQTGSTANGLQRLSEVFGDSRTRLAEVCAMADRVRRGEAIDVGDGQVLMRDAPDAATGAVVEAR